MTADDELLPLPLPDSDELAEILPRKESRRIYAYLHDRRNNPPTQVEIEEHLREVRGESHSNPGRRRRELAPLFEVKKVGSGRRPGYLLVGLKPTATSTAADSQVTGALRAQVLHHQRCAMCGKTPLKHGVELQVDHRLPRAWGGLTVLENLQPLCTECNHDKSALFSTFTAYEENIKQAARLEDPRQRLGELLRAFGRDGWVSSDLLEAVASAKEPQDDWHRRLRELRDLGWDYRFRKKRVGARVRVDYQLTKSAPWPDDIPRTIRLNSKS